MRFALALAVVTFALPVAISKSTSSFCSEGVCVHATVNHTFSNVDYLVTTTGIEGDVGWIAVGFGNKMDNADMIVLWANEDGTMTLSQRSALGHVMPTVNDSPLKSAVPRPGQSSLLGPNPSFAFSIPLGDEPIRVVNHVYALSSHRPISSARDSPIRFHDLGFGRFVFNSPSSDGKMYTGQQRLVIAHATLASLGFLVALPVGAIIARLARTRSPQWFQWHWGIQYLLAGPLIVVGISLAIRTVAKEPDDSHFDDTHKKTGLALFVLYAVQCLLGALIHFCKVDFLSIMGRSPQNYFHAILGLAIIGVAFIQVHNGFKIEWGLVRGPAVPKAIEIVFWVWLATVTLVYTAGLGLLKKQYSQERGQEDDDRQELIQ